MNARHRMVFTQMWTVALLLPVILLFGCGDDDDAYDDAEVDADDDSDDDTNDDVDDDVDDDVNDDDVDDDTDDDTGECEPLFPDLKLVAHRGARTWAPENTIAAIEQAFALGADAVEMDVSDTADGEFVLMHDDTVDRTTNGHGRVDEMTLDDILALRVDDWMFGGVHGVLRVPTFEEALIAVRDAGGEADLDMKTDEVEGAMAVVVALGMEDAVYVYSGSVDKLDRVRVAAPGVRIQPPTSSAAETQALLDYFDPDPEHIELTEDGFTPDNLALIETTEMVVAMDALGVRDILAAILDIKGAWREMAAEGVEYMMTDFGAETVAWRASMCE